MEIRNSYTPHSRETVSFEGVDSLTEQHHAERVNIVNIVQRWRAGQAPTELKSGTPLFGNFENATELLEMRLRVDQADEMFIQHIPARARALAGNDPAELLAVVRRWEAGTSPPEEIEAYQAAGLFQTPPERSPEASPTPAANGPESGSEAVATPSAPAADPAAPGNQGSAT